VHGWRITMKITALNFRARASYRADLLLSVFTGLAWQVSVLVFAGVLLARFGGIGGWSQGGVLLIASMRLLSHGLYVATLGNIMWLPFVMQEGRLEGYLMRPLPVYRQVLLSQFPLNALGDCAAAVALFALTLAKLHLAWTPARAAYLVAAVVGGTFAEGAAQTAISSVSFRGTTGLAWFNWVDTMFASFGNYPLRIMPPQARYLLTFGLPVAFVAYLPAAALTGRAGGTGLPGWLVVASPAAGPLLYAAARLVWNRALNRYEVNGG
jgi:viologen exporter family transport system permease protein